MYDAMKLNGFDFINQKGKKICTKNSQTKNIKLVSLVSESPRRDGVYSSLEQACYWKGMTSQSTCFCKRCSECQNINLERGDMGSYTNECRRDRPMGNHSYRSSMSLFNKSKKAWIQWQHHKYRVQCNLLYGYDRSSNSVKVPNYIYFEMFSMIIWIMS